MSLELVIFDFDGVVADSEALACAVAADLSTALGYPLTHAQGVEKFVGKNVTDVASIISKGGGKVPADFEQKLLNETLKIFQKRLEPIPGVEEFVESLGDLKFCIASSSSHQRLEASLKKIGLLAYFRGRVFSVDDVERGKPFPDVFLYASKSLGVHPEACIVIEDSTSGVRAGVQAGMTVVGMLAGSHIGLGHGQKLMDLGAFAVVNSYQELNRLLDSLS